MSMKKAGDGIEKSSSREFIRRDSKRNKQSETAPVDIDSEDKGELSWKALDIKEMQSKALLFPLERLGRVEQIKRQVEDGTYKIFAEKIAECLIEEAMEL